MKPSKIHGTGAFALRDIRRGELVEDPGFDSKFKGYNHSCNPNILLGQIPSRLLSAVGTNVVAFALRPIKKGEELTVWYGGPRLVSASRPSVCNCPACRDVG